MEWVQLRDYAADGYGCLINQDGLITPVPFQGHCRIVEKCFGCLGEHYQYGWIAITHHNQEISMFGYYATKKSRNTAKRLIRDLARDGQYIRFSECMSTVENAQSLIDKIDRLYDVSDTQMIYSCPTEVGVVPAISYVVLGSAGVCRNEYLIDYCEIDLPPISGNVDHPPTENDILDNIINFGIRYYNKIPLFIYNDDNGMGRDDAILKCYEMIFDHKDNFKSFINKPFYEMLMNRAKERGFC